MKESDQHEGNAGFFVAAMMVGATCYPQLPCSIQEKAALGQGGFRITITPWVCREVMVGMSFSSRGLRPFLHLSIELDSLPNKNSISLAGHGGPKGALGFRINGCSLRSPAVWRLQGLELALVARGPR